MGDVEDYCFCFTSGDAGDLDNYRSITMVPIVANLFSIVVYGPIADCIVRQLDEEQNGFRRRRGCSGAVDVVCAVIGKSLESGEQLLGCSTRCGKQQSTLFTILFLLKCCQHMASSLASRRLCAGCTLQYFSIAACPAIIFTLAEV